jgi:flagellin
MDNRINTNLESLRARRELGNTEQRLERSFGRLGSGRRIASAADDPAGLAISERMRAQLRSLTQAVQNTRSGIDYVRTADGALGEVGDNLGRLRELAVQASNGTLSPEDRALLGEEAAALTAEIDSVATSTEFNGAPVLDGSGVVTLQVGDDAGETIDVDAIDARAAALGIDSVDLSSEASASASLAAIDAAIDKVSGLRGNLGGLSRELSSRQDSVLAARDSLLESESRISSLDIAIESARLAQERILSNAGIATLLQANAQPQRALQLLQ